MGFLPNKNVNNVPTIPEFFKNKTIFITGGSGFMGQALVEKLLYSCPGLERIYLLIRKKRDDLPEHRLEKLFSSSCFDRLRKEKPSIFYEKVHIIAGDILELGLDLSDVDRALLIKEVNVVFHAAASVRFEDPLSYAAKLNLRGTRELIELSKEMKNLLSFIHVSTSYCNCKYDVIDEVLYPPLADWREVLEICDTMDEDTLRILTPKYLNGMPNTYVFTKQLAEHLVNEQHSRLPVAIIRPSVVTGSKEEPAPGWVNNLNGPCGLFIAVGKGLKYSIYANEDTRFNYIPVDVCIRSFIIVAWALGTNRLRQTDNIPIFNCTSNQHDMLTVREMSLRSFAVNLKWPLEEIIWLPKIPVITNNFFIHLFTTIFCSIIPAIIIDLILRILGKKARLLRIQRKVYVADLAIKYFMSRNWQFFNKNFLEIRQHLMEEDKKDFHFKIEKLFADDSFLEATIRGGQKYLLNVDDNSFPRAKKIHYRMKVMDRVFRVIFYSGFLWIIINTKYFQNVCQKFWLLLK